MDPKTLNNHTGIGASDACTFGDTGAWQLLCKASSDSQGWMKSTKAMQIDGAGCLVQVTTQQCNPDGSYVVAEALTFVSGVEIKDGQLVPGGMVAKTKGGK